MTTLSDRCTMGSNEIKQQQPQQQLNIKECVITKCFHDVHP